MDKNMMDHDYRVLKQTAVNSLVVMFCVIIVTIVCTKYKHSTIYANNTSDNADISASEPSESKSRIEDTETIQKRLKRKYLRIIKPEGGEFKLSLNDLYMKQSIELHMSGLSGRGLSYDSVLRNNGEMVFKGKPQNSGMDSVISTITSFEDEEESVDFVRDITITYNYNESADNYSANIEILMDNVYVHTIYEDEDYFYVKLELPRDVYDRLIVVDIGHGGKDGGTYPPGRSTEEKDINLNIGLYLKELLDKEDIKVYYTRLSDETVFLRPRVTLANNLNADFFISIHCNGSELRQPNGTEILYKKEKNQGGIKSQRLAEIFLEELAETVKLRNRGVIDRNDIYIIGNSKVPVALIEVAYMTNPNDFLFLIEEENQAAAAVGIRNGIMRTFRKLESD